MHRQTDRDVLGNRHGGRQKYGLTTTQTEKPNIEIIDRYGNILYISGEHWLGKVEETDSQTGIEYVGWPGSYRHPHHDIQYDTTYFKNRLLDWEWGVSSTVIDVMEWRWGRLTLIKTGVGFLSGCLSNMKWVIPASKQIITDYASSVNSFQTYTQHQSELFLLLLVLQEKLLRDRLYKIV